MVELPPLQPDSPVTVILGNRGFEQPGRRQPLWGSDRGDEFSGAGSDSGCGCSWFVWPATRVVCVLGGEGDATAGVDSGRPNRRPHHAASPAHAGSMRLLPSRSPRRGEQPQTPAGSE